MAPKNRIIECSQCHRTRQNHGKQMCSACYKRAFPKPKKIGVCANCKHSANIAHRGLCHACYKYWCHNGEHRPPDSITRRLPQDYFREEWHHMTVTMRMDEYAAERRLAEAFGITVESVQIRAKKLEKAAA